MSEEGSFTKHLSGFPSDHTYQIVNVQTETPDNKEISLTGMTWDLMNKGHSAAMGNGKSNNPFDLDETDKAYALRKKKQLRFLISKISKASLDFVFLQEVDIFTRSPLPKFVMAFLNGLKKIGWRVVHSDKNDNLNIPLVTLYDANKLNFISKTPVLLAKNGKNTALEAELIHVASNVHVCLTNINLDHETNHNKDISDYQAERVSKEKLVIMGGDTHPGSGVLYQGMIGDINQPTSIYSLIDEVDGEKNG